MKATKLKLFPLALAVVCTINVNATMRYVDLNSPSPTPPYTNWPTAATNIQDAIDAAFEGDLVIVNDGTYKTGGRVVSGAVSNRIAVAKAVTVQSFNGPESTIIEGLEGSFPDGNGAVRCVYLTNFAILSGFTLTNGHTKTSGPIADDYEGAGAWCEVGAIVTNCLVVSNAAGGFGGGVYGGTLYNCTVAGNSAGIGGGVSSSTLYDCDLIKNVAWNTSGGGAYQSMLSNCTISANWAHNDGGGVDRSTNYNCILIGNSNSYSDAGGASFSKLYNCTLIGNSLGARNSGLYNCTVVSNYSTLTAGAGISGGVAYNCIVYFNVATSNPNWGTGAVFTNCCTTPLPPGAGNYTNAPVFINPTAGNLRLQTNSPGINGGNNIYAPATTDLDSRPRITDGTVDVGAYEHQGPGMGEFIGWLEQMGLPTDGSADFVDTDGEGMNNWQEWRADTIPTNSASALRMFSPTGNLSGVTVSWESVSTRRYWLDRATNLTASPVFSIIATNLAGQAGATTYPDTSATNDGPYFYRVGVEP